MTHIRSARTLVAEIRRVYLRLDEVVEKINENADEVFLNLFYR